MIRFLYNLLWPLGFIFFLPGYLAKMFRRGDYRANFGQRLGIYDVDVVRRLTNRKPIWVHAVSVGEVGIASKLIGAVRELNANAEFVLTTTTTTGFAVATNNAPAWIEVLYAPLDFWPIMRRALRVIRPRAIVLVEAEVWPNLLAEAHARRIPVALINARLSPRSEKRFRRFGFFVRPTFRLLDLLLVPEPADVERWEALGIPPGRIHPVGSVKYDPQNATIDATVPHTVLHELKIDNRPILLGGSTHPGEEEFVAQVFRALRRDFPELFLILAPRHAERGRAVARLLEQMELRVVLRSRASATDHPADCLVLDSTGELRNWYAVATIVFIGKSLLAHGGQNPAEAILARKPVVFGPHMENFAAFARALVARGGAIQIRSAEELRGTIVDLLRDTAARERRVTNASQVLAAHTGATARTAKLIIDLNRAEE
ncbi:MAG TPA: glycosyltransferase N-terminal domain-containing protein [Chthoniobacterales bacterium]|nr:glycosyltransferase N-terminal domain-containing protein [Chthoniobacterales bacterium]